MAPRTAKRTRPSLTSLLRLRSQIRAVLASLNHAQARTSDVHERARLVQAEEEVGKRLERLERALESIKHLHELRRRYEARMALLDQKSEHLIGRQFRAGQRWLRRWENL